MKYTITNEDAIKAMGGMLTCRVMCERIMESLGDEAAHARVCALHDVYDALTDDGLEGAYLMAHQISAEHSEGAYVLGMSAMLNDIVRTADTLARGIE